MNTYVTGKIIKELREKKNMTQAELARLINVSDKTISKWETNRGLPDISIIDPLAKALNVSVIELMNGEYIVNKNMSANMLKSRFYVCPVCGNVITSTGDALISCCGISLPALEADDSESIHVERIEDEYYVKVMHQMTKDCFISFISYVTCDRVQIYKLYPEQDCTARFKICGRGIIYAYSNKDGLFKHKI